jgi:hypothetical protein
VGQALAAFKRLQAAHRAEREASTALAGPVAA